MPMPQQKAPPRLAALTDLADKGVVIGYETDHTKLSEFVAGLKLENRSAVVHRDPVLSSQAMPLYVIAVYTNKRDRPLYSLYSRLRLSPRNRSMTSFVTSRAIHPGQKVAFIFEVQKTVAPEVAHFNFSETASGLDDTGQSIVQHVPKQFLIGTHSAAITSVGGGVKDQDTVIHADAQPGHFEAPSSATQFMERAKNRPGTHTRR